jgi:hypothetical protein
MEISRNNYEEFFLLYLDRELDTAGRRSVEDFLINNRDLQKEFTLLQQTFITAPDTIFENRELLFRQEEKKPVITLFWMRMAAAVAVLILGSWLLISQMLKNHPENTVAKDQVAVVNNTTIVHAQKTAPGNSKQKQSSFTAKSGNNKGNENHGSTVRLITNNDRQINQEADETIPAARNSNADLAVQYAGKREGMEVRPVAVVQPSADALVVLTKTNTTVNNEYDASKETDDQTDNAISVVALNDSHKGITKFFKKFTKQTPADNNARKVRVSVFQFSY